ncbi:FecR domain-containing protein [Luteolibacter marinus]|uniref:FecR domain-containing protein n=1 Tax=Luteolibacter marinus TaxID=2776705 RepID=UPI001867D10D|nr:FecR domain-containing protein [Luteolibacter marinus]
MTGDIPDEFIDLIVGLEEGNLDEAGRSRLVEMIREQPELRAAVTEHFAVSRALSEFDRPDANFAGRTAAHIAKVAAEGEFGFAGKVTRRIIRRRIVKGLAAAAVVALALLPFLRDPAPELGPKVAELTRKAADGSYLDPVAVHAGEVLEASSGLVRLNFENGAVVAIGAPAKFTVVSPMEITLESGRMNGWCPEAAHGFTVRTASATLTDRGTSFGITATEDGHSEFMVLDGLVEVQKGREMINLAEGAAIKSGVSDRLKVVAFDPSEFKSTWPLSLGILSVRGAVIAADPDVSENLLKQEDDDHVLVIPEVRERAFTRPLRAEIIAPGTLPGDIDGKVHVLKPDPTKRLSSFVMRYNPVGSFLEDRFLRFEGEVTFDRKVLAIACQGPQLAHGDAAFSTTGKWPGIYRGIELEQKLNPPDQVTLSEDRRTVKVVFYAGQSTDDIRVILEDN